MNPNPAQDRRRLARERYIRLATPFHERMVELRLLYTHPTIGPEPGQVGEVWTNEQAKKIYEGYAKVIEILRDTCMQEDSSIELPPL